MTATELFTSLISQGFTLIPLPGDKLEVRPGSRLTPELRQELKWRKAEVLALLAQQSSSWPCPHCGNPAEVEDVCPSLDRQRTLTLWQCEPCQTWGVTPDTLRQPPVWTPRTEQ